MKWIRIGSLGQFSPLGLLATGLAIGIGTPVIKKSLRGLAVLTAKGILAVSGNLKETGEQISTGWQQMVTEAREQREINRDNIREHLHNTGVTAVRSGLAVADEVQGVVNTAKETINKYAEEARQDLSQTVMSTTSPETTREESCTTCNYSPENEEFHQEDKQKNPLPD